MDLQGRKLKGRGKIEVTREDPWTCGMYTSKKWYLIGLAVLYIMIIACLVGLWSSGGCAVQPADLNTAPVLAETIQEVRPHVVHIRAQGGQGSGCVICPTGLVVTARHVTDGFHGPYTVTFDDGTVMKTSLVWEDPNNDVAYLQLPLRDGQLIDSSALAFEEPQVGDKVVIFGSPLGYDFFNTASPGYVTALDRDLNSVLDMYDDERRFMWIHMIQTNAPSYPGNSGGPVYDESGEVVGILVAGWDATLNFAVSCTSIRDTVMEATIDLFNGRCQFVEPRLQYEDYYFSDYVGVP